MLFNRDNQDKRVKMPVPFLKDSTVLFVDSREGEAHIFIEENKEDLRNRFFQEGFKFLYLPDLMENLSSRTLRYLYPGLTDTVLVEDLYQNLQNFTGLGDRSGFLYKQEGSIYFHTLPEAPGTRVKAAVDDFIASIRPKKEPQYDDELRFSKRSIDEVTVFNDLDLSPSIEPEEQSEEPLDPRTQAIIDAWERIEKEFGITLEDLDVILNYRITLSRLTISTSNRIFMADLPGRPEVKLDDLTKTLYFFYLRHPAGAAFKDLMDFEDEVYRIYLGITGRDDLEGIRRTVAALVAPYSSGRDSCVSRIKKAFRDIVGDRIAKYYYIDGRAGGVRSVRLNRDLVIWEH